MKLIVDMVQRYAKMRAHTATHLLHAELVKIISNTKQAGSLVDEDYLRFDFYSDALLNSNQLIQIQENVNEIIKKGVDVVIKEMSYDDAVKSGAKAFFEDKYRDIVRVVKIGEDISTELCGGTHVFNTREIGAFSIISQEAVASGIKRIVAVTGSAVAVRLLEKESEIKNIASLLGVQESQINDKINKDRTNFSELEARYKSLSSSFLASNFFALIVGKNDGFDIVLINKDNVFFELFDDVMDYVKSNNDLSEVIVASEDGKFLIKSVSGRAKEFAKNNGLKGGGSDNLVQGRDSKILEIFVRG